MSFEKYLELSDSPCEPVAIPYEDSTLPGYFCRSPLAIGPAPVLLFQEGRDAWAEDGKFIADEAMKRGYHALMFDGPGMAKVIRIQGLVFRHDWENVVTPVVDFASSLPEVDATRIGLISVSMGGYMGPRAAAFDDRIKLLVANPGVLRWATIYESFLNAIDPGLMDLLETDEDAFNAASSHVELAERTGRLHQHGHLPAVAASIVRNQAMCITPCTVRLAISATHSLSVR